MRGQSHKEASKGAGRFPLGQRVSRFLFLLGQEATSVENLASWGNRLLVLLHDVQEYSNLALFLEKEGWQAPVAVLGSPHLPPDACQKAANKREMLHMQEDPKAALLLVPLTHQDKTIGVLAVEARRFGKRDIAFFQTVTPFIASLLSLSLRLEELGKAAFTDALTGAYNYRSFRSRLEEELARARRYRLSLSLALMDIDGLKEVNDKYGHLAGDEALRQVAHSLRERLRTSDVIARYGGDEFAILLPETTSEEAEKVVDQLHHLLDNSPFSWEGSTLPLPSRSIGLASFPSDGDSAELLLKAADRRLYQKKGKSPNSR